MARLLAVWCALLVASVGLAGVPAQGVAGPGALDLAEEFDRVQFRIAVQADGSARWTFRYERTLANASERRQFEAFAERFRTNETPLYRDFREQASALVEHGERAAGRNMTARGFERDAAVRTQLNTVGVVRLGFTWGGFALAEGSRVIVGDVFEGGLYLGPDQALVVAAGEGLRFRSVAPDGTPSGATLPASDTVTWWGERTFADNHPRIVLEAAEGPASTATAADRAETAEPGEGSPDASSTPGNATAPPAGGSSWLLAGLVAVLAAVGLAAVWYRRGGSVPGAPTGDVGDGAGPDGAGVLDATEDAVMDDDERVGRLLRENGGRMRQSAIVEETGWSKSKVSMVLSEMEEADQLTKLRVGRENLVSLPGHEPEAARSPYEND